MALAPGGGAAVRVPGGYGVVARLWATMRAMVAKIRTGHAAAPPLTRLHLLRAQLLEIVSGPPADLRHAWALASKGTDIVMAICDASNAGERVERSRVQQLRKGGGYSHEQRLFAF